MINEDGTSVDHQKLRSHALARFNDVLHLETEKEIQRLTSLLAVADFYPGGSRELLHDILWGEKYAHVSMEVKAVIANANRHHQEEAVVWSYRYREGVSLELFIQNCDLQIDMVPLVAANENVTGTALNTFLDGYSSPATKIAYVEQLSIVNFTEDFMREVWHRLSRRNYDAKINPIIIAKFKTVWNIGSEVPNSWVTHTMNQIEKKHIDSLFNRF